MDFILQIWGGSFYLTNKPVLAIQQAVLLCFVVYGFMTAVKVASVKNAHSLLFEFQKGSAEMIWD